MQIEYVGIVLREITPGINVLNFEDSDNIPMSLTQYDLNNFAGILSEPQRFDWYTAHLIRLCRKADRTNIRKLATIYPDVVAAFMIYWIGSVPDDFQDIIPDWEYYTKMMKPYIFKEDTGR
jgi:hypothetical protein